MENTQIVSIIFSLYKELIENATCTSSVSLCQDTFNGLRSLTLKVDIPIEMITETKKKKKSPSQKKKEKTRFAA